MTQLNLTMNPGLEDIAISEFRHRFRQLSSAPLTCHVAPQDLKGQILIDSVTSLETILIAANQMRSVHHLSRPVDHFALPSQDQLSVIEQRLKHIDIDEMTEAKRFRVTSKRSGSHDYTSVDIQKVAGAALVARYGCEVDLTNFDTNIRVDVYQDLCTVSVQLTKSPLDYRYDYVHRPRIALKTNVAFSLLVLAGLKPDGVTLSHNNPSPRLDSTTVLDPFCGSGTILLEAAHCLPSATLYASDRFAKPVKWTNDNLNALGLGDRADLCQADARDLDEIYPLESIDAIVTNPPFGAQLGQGTNFYGFYLKFLRAAYRILAPNARITLLVWKRVVFNRVVQQLPYRICHARVIDLGGLYPGIFVLQKE